MLSGILAVALATGAAAQEDRKQTRPAKTRVDVKVESVRVQDGDTVLLDWGNGDLETVRILGIDTPETANIEHNLPYDQPFGREAAGFARGAFATATAVQLLRADQMDPYGRSLGYLFINGKNYSELVVRARLAAESVTHFGDNGFPAEAQAVVEAAKAAGPLPFEPPHEFRRRMRDVTEHLRATGALPPKPPEK
jgi:endonuclease YncB( thermonuclease family)